MSDLDNIKKEGFEVYTVTSEPYVAQLNATSMLEQAIEEEQENMYYDWDNLIWNDITEEDIKDMQSILDRILSRRPSSNIRYIIDEWVIIDI